MILYRETRGEFVVGLVFIAALILAAIGILWGGTWLLTK